MATLAAAGRADLGDAQWAVLEPLLPRGKKPGRPPKWTKRQLIDGIRWRARAGAPWRDVPPAYGPWQTVYGLFRRWQRDGTWREILTSLQAGPYPLRWTPGLAARFVGRARNGFDTPVVYDLWVPRISSTALTRGVACSGLWA
jgi:transposase